LGFRQWLTPHEAQVTGGGEASSAPHAEQKRTSATERKARRRV